MALLKVVYNQTNLNFTGRINILEKGNGKYLGRISILEGTLVFAQYRGNTGRPALYHIVIDDMEDDSLSFVVEPEIVTMSEAIFELSYEEFLETSQSIYQAYQSSKKFRPPDHLRLLINPDFIPRGPKVSYSEFETLTVISDFNKVSDIFENSPLLEYQTCNSLVSLRKKGALKVLG